MAMKKAIWILLLGMAISLSGCVTAETNLKEDGLSISAEESERQTQGEEEKIEESSLSGEPDGKDTETDDKYEMCGVYFKEGNFDYLLLISGGGTPEEETLNYEVQRRMPGEEMFPSQLVLQGSFDDNRGNVCLNLSGEGIVELVVSEEADSELSGSYYKIEDYLPMYEMFVRPLNKADLLGKSKEDLRILRNEFYAVYGRKFTDITLREYFLKQPWYREIVEPEQFDNNIFSDLIRRNITFLQEAESQFGAETEEQNRQYAKLSDAPYKELLEKQISVWSRKELPWFEGIGIELEMDPDVSEDRGLYYITKGKIKAPLTITQDEYENIMAGEEISLTINETTGEMVRIWKNEEKQGPLFLCVGSTVSEEIYHCQYLPQYKSYILTITNDDLCYKTVYQGDIYVLKGAESSFAQTIYQLSTGDYARKIEPEEKNIFRGGSTSFDEKGYIRAVIYTGA